MNLNHRIPVAGKPRFVAGMLVVPADITARDRAHVVGDVDALGAGE